MIAATGPITIVSGAASGIGRHMAVSLARAGHRLMLTDIDSAGLEKLAAEHGWQGSNDFLLHTLDVRSAAGWDVLVERAQQHFGGLDLVLNIAGYLRVGNITDIELDAIDKQVDINVKGVMYATRAAARVMVAQGRGHIINVASIAAVSHVPGLAVYCASKHAVRGFTLSVAHELGKYGVKVTVFCPDAVETPMLVQQEARPEAAMTFGAGRALSLQEVEAALLRAIERQPLEVVLDVPRSGRALGAKLANMFPRLTGLAADHIQRQGKRVQARRVKST
jgi:NAD(P)-dependent dehydrogenase (short-subunit alcohol dehydrogenase family)